MKDREILMSYIPMVGFLGEAIGSNCEVALYDVIDKEGSLIAISNNSVSKREIGDPLTKTSIKMIDEKLYDDKNFITRYPSKTRDGRILRSSTLFIKNSAGDLLGLLTISINMEEIISSANFLNKLLTELTGGPERNLAEERGPISEDFSIPIEDYAKSIIQNTLSDVNVSPERMSPEEKIEIVHKLDNKGVFLLKGAITEVARQLKASETTIYRYISKKGE